MNRSEKGFRAGAAEADITPPLGTQIDGDIGRRRPAETMLEPLYAKALVLERQSRRACIISADLLALTKEWCDRIRSGAEARYGIPRDSVVVHVTQNHAAPSLGQVMTTETNNLLPATGDWSWARGSDTHYIETVTEKLMDLIGRASDSLQPAHICVGRELDGRFAFNRRYVLRDGTAQMYPGPCRREDILYREGPIDPEVGVALIANEKLDNIAVLLHHTCHPVHGYPMNYISSGWPGAWCRSMKERLGAGCVPLVVNGCCGNIIHYDPFDPAHDGEDYEAMGRGLAQTSIKALKRARFFSDPDLTVASRHLRIPMRGIPDAALAKARKVLREHPEPVWDKTGRQIDTDWWYAMSVLDLADHWGENAVFDYEIQAIRIGGLSIVAMGGEPFVEGQLQIKLASPSPYTFVAHMCNYYVGYIPTPEAFGRGGYETRTGLGSKLCPEALQMIADGAVDLLKNLDDTPLGEERQIAPEGGLIC